MLWLLSDKIKPEGAQFGHYFLDLENFLSDGGEGIAKMCRWPGMSRRELSIGGFWLRTKLLGKRKPLHS